MLDEIENFFLADPLIDVFLICDLDALANLCLISLCYKSSALFSILNKLLAGALIIIDSSFVDFKLKINCFITFLLNRRRVIVS